MVPQWVIEHKRDGHELAGDDIAQFIHAYAAGEIPDYQMAALAMAVYFQGMTFAETTSLTDAMLRSGDILDTSAIPLPKVDKHSTGGIGDKVSLILAPLLACCGTAVPMLSGRGLGITGGTLDKLESIPGYRTDLSTTEFLNLLANCGCAITGQTERLAPADRKLYALRDVTGTVPSIPLISASIMSKKLAEGMDALVLDVKCGLGAFMKNPEDARKLARTMVEVGKRMDKQMTALLTDMNQPLGRTAGNALEVREVIDALQGNGPDDLMELTMRLSAHLLLLAGKSETLDGARATLQQQLDSGQAWERFKTMVQGQGGEVTVLEQPKRLPTAPVRMPIPATQNGYVAGVHAEQIGRACLLLGAGRRKTTDTINPAVGISDILKIGEPVEQGDALAMIHAANEQDAQEAKDFLQTAFTVASTPVAPAVLVYEVVT